MKNPDTEYIIERVFENLKKRYFEQEDNLLIIDRLFMARPIVREVVEKKFSGEYTDQDAARILNLLEKYLKGEIELIREEGEIKVVYETNYDKERQKALESLRAAYKKMLEQVTDNLD